MPKSPGVSIYELAASLTSPAHYKESAMYNARKKFTTWQKIDGMIRAGFAGLFIAVVLLHAAELL